MSDSTHSYSDDTDDALLALLFTEEDRLPRESVNEMISRGGRLVDPLTWIVMDPQSWRANSPARWAPIHATFILGAIGGDAVILGLLTASDHAETADCDWVLTVLPSIFGRLGAVVRPYLSERVRDRARQPLSRAIMAECLAATTVAEPAGADAVFAELGSVFGEAVDDTLKELVGSVLMDFSRAEYGDALLLHAGQQVERRRHDAAQRVAYTPQDVARMLAPDATPDLGGYTADWLTFYAPEEIARRQARWANEDAENTGADVELAEEEWPAEPIAQVVRRGPKISRNATCPCGSGKKYKKCCLEIDAALGPLGG